MQHCQTLQAINADGDATRALINVNTVNDLRDELLRERRRSDNRDIEISITNSNAQTQAQIQAQAQAQGSQLGLFFHNLNDQIAKQNQGIINLGTMVGNSQAASNTNVKA